MTREKDQELELTPKLRFSEFVQSGEWDFKPLKALAKRRSVRNVGENIVRVLTNSAEYGIVDQKDYFDKDIAKKGNLETYFIVAEGDYVYNPRISSLAPVGPIHKNKVGTGVMSPLYTVFRFDNDENDFYEHYFRSDHWHKYLRLVSNTGARHDRMAIPNGDFFEMPLPKPSFAEQRKISECLSSLNLLIATEAAKLVALRDHRKGLIQGLFPAEGEPVPTLRFPKFQSDNGWAPVQLGALCNMKAGKFVSASEILEEQHDGLFPCFGGNGLRGYTRSHTNKGKYPLIGRQGALCGNVTLADGKFHATEHAIVAEPRHRTSVDWLYYALVHLNLNKFATGQAQPGLSVEVLEKVNCAAPNDTQEQKMIAECLSSIDMLIVYANDKISALRDLRKGLMQQLFQTTLELSA